MIGTFDLAGDARARGEALGAALRPRIEAHIAAWLPALPSLGEADPAAYPRRMLRETDFLPAIERHTPDLLAEVRGIAAGAGLDPDLVLALQLIDEEWAYRDRLRLSHPRQKCSSFGLALPGQPTWIGQNMDLGPHTDGHQIALRLAPGGDRPGALLLSLVGVIALLGANDAGIAVCVNSLPQLPSAPRGLPVAFVIRRLLQARGLEEAVDLVRSLPHATNQHYLLAGPGAIRSFETSAAGVVEYMPADSERVLHTNHPLAAPEELPDAAIPRENSVARLASLASRLAQGVPTLDALRAALSSFDDARHPVCRLKTDDNGLIGFTTGSMISALRPGSLPECWMSAGPPSLEGYAKLEWTERQAAA